MRRFLLALSTAAVFCLLTLVIRGHQPARAEERDWPAYGGGPKNLRYSPLAQINRDNVSQLQVAWRFDAGDAYPGSEMECNPIVVDGVLYTTTPSTNVIALDAGTGKLRWRFNPNEGLRIVGKMRNRGVTYWASGGDKRIFFSVRQYLYALNAVTGEAIPSFGHSGRIDLRDGLGRDPKDWVSLSTPGIVYKDLLIVGSLVAETLPSGPGDIRAYDARTGKLRWSFHTIPHPGEFGYDTWPKDAWKYIGGANNWSGMSLDEKTGMLYVPTGSAAADFYGANRQGDLLFTDSLLALNAETGKRIWHFQLVKHDIWDRDFPAPPSLVTVERDGKTVEAVSQTTKSGYVLVFDRATGRPLFPYEMRKVPQSDIPGEATAGTQLFPLVQPFARQKLTADMLTERTPAAHAAALKEFQKLRSDGQFVPGSKQGTIIFPGFDGGAEWGGTAFDPGTGMLYVNSNECAWILRLVEQKPPAQRASGSQIYQRECSMCHRADRKGTPPEFPSLLGVNERYSADDVHQLVEQGAGRMPGFARLGSDAVNAVVDYVYYGKDATAKIKQNPQQFLRFASDGYNKFLDPDGYPAIAPPWGTLNAIDLNTGKIVWKIPFGEYPELAASGTKNTGSDNYGGPVVTAGGLVFIAATNYDKKMHAFDKATGKLLWETTLPAAGNATPAVYEMNGREYVVIAAGGGKSKDPSGSSIIAFALPK